MPARPFTPLLAGLALSLSIIGAPAASLPAFEGRARVPLDHLPALRGDYFRIESASTGGAYHIYVRYPEGYETAGEAAEPDGRYPTVYLTDGDSLFPILAASHLFLTYDERLPEALVVGIAYGSFDPSINRRNIDFTGPAPGEDPQATGAARFQRFLKTELMPIIEGRYRSDPERRILFGQSRGGGFVVYSALTDPDLFWGRIASNPAFRPEGDWPLAEPAAASGGDGGLMVVSGSRDWPGLRQDALAWFDHWRERSTPWRLRTLTLDGGTHAANAPDAYRAGLLWLFGKDAAGQETGSP